MMVKASPVAKEMRPVSDELTAFMHWYFEGGLKLLPPQDGLLCQSRPGTSVSSVVLYRKDCFQVEMVQFAPGSKVPSHRHDHIESYEVWVSGGISFFVDGRQTSFVREPRADGTSRDLLKYLPIPCDAYHGGEASDLGACFLSVQRWIGMDPSHVGLEWQDESNQAFEP